MGRSKYLIKNVGLLAISNFSSKILVFLLVPLYTSVLTTAEYGTYDLIISTVSLLYPILTINILESVMRFMMDESINKRSIISIAVRYICVSIAIIVVISCGLHLFGIWTGILLFFLFYYVTFVFYQLCIQTAKGLEYVRDMAIAGVISTLTMVAGNIAFLLIFHWSLKGFLAASILSQFLSGMYLFVRMRFWKYVKIDNIDRQLEKDMLFFSAPLIVTSLGWWINNTLDKYAVALLCGVDANGILSISYKIPSILNTLQGIFIQAWQISAIKEYGGSDTQRFYGKTFSAVNIMMCATCAGLILLTRPLGHILYTGEFYIAWMYVPFLLISSVMNCASFFLGPILSAKRKTKTMMWSTTVGVGINAMLNILGILLIGIQGATVATMISSLAICLIRIHGVGDDIAIEDKYYLTWTLLIAQATVEVTIGNRWIELILCGIMFAVNWNHIKNMMDWNRIITWCREKVGRFKI